MLHSLKHISWTSLSATSSLRLSMIDQSVFGVVSGTFYSLLVLMERSQHVHYARLKTSHEVGGHCHVLVVVDLERGNTFISCPIASLSSDLGLGVFDRGYLNALQSMSTVRRVLVDEL